MDYYALEWEKRSTFREFGEISLFSKKLLLDLAQCLHFRQSVVPEGLKKKITADAA